MARVKKVDAVAGELKYEPLGDRIIVERIESAEVSQGGIILAEAAREKPVEGTVVAVGEGRVRPDGTVMPIQLRIGDRVLYGRYSGVDTELNHRPYLVLRVEEVMAKVVNA